MEGRVAARCLAISCLALCLHQVATSECSNNPECACYFGENKDGGVNLNGSGSDSRSIGLSAATGALSSLVLAGGGIALWKHCKGNHCDVDDMYGRPPSSHGSWMEERKYPRRGSFPYSDDGLDTNGRFRGTTTRSHPTNIYKHGGKIWPGSY